MALAIEPTPKLNAKAAVQFLKKVKRDLKRPVRLTADPNIIETQRKIEAYFAGRKK
jgi:hypothetical protein